MRNNMAANFPSAIVGTVAAVDIRARRYPPAKISVALEVGREAGLPASLLLEGSGLGSTDVGSTETLTSIDQFLTVVRNLVRHYPGHHAGIEMAHRLPISHYGIYSYAILCAATLRQACDIAIRYAMPNGSLFDVSIKERSDEVTWVFVPRAGMTLTELGPQVYRTLLEAQFIVFVRAMVDVMQPDCIPLRARFSMPAPAHADDLVRAFGCPILFDQPVDELDYPRFWLERAPRLASPLTSVSVCKTLARQLEAYTWTAGIAMRVHQELTRTPGSFPTMEAVASKLCVTSRHLRRKLEAEGTSYQKLLAGVREAMAIDYLASSRLTTEQIAPVLGFSDATSFRHAFKRWTGKTPSQFRGGP
jgi:AraC-like DNA-binding protein